MAITIEDIAREAGVSIATVSRVINKTKPVSAALRERVYEVIERNNFKPNSLAQGLITKKTNTIGIIVPDISNAVFGKLTKGINHIFAKQGYTVILCESQGQLENELKMCIRDSNNSVPKDMYEESIKGKYNYTLKDTFMGFHCGNTASGKLVSCEMKYQMICLLYTSRCV